MNFFSRATAAAGALAVAGALAIAPSAAFANQPVDEPPVLRPAAAALNNPLEPGTYAGDTPDGPVIVVFSLDGFTDPEEEDWDISTVLLPGVSEMRVTGGGDGSAATWSAVLAGADVLVLPEGSNWSAGGTAAISDEALEVIRTWVSAGRLIVGTGSYTHGDIVSELTGVDFVLAFENNDSNGPWQQVGDDADLPAELPNGNYTGGLDGFSLFSDEQKAVITPLYYNSDTDNLGVASFAIGTGSYIYHAYDWYPDSDELVNGVRDTWNGILGISAGSVTPPPAVPELAATGDSMSTSILLGAGALLLAGAAAGLVARRRQRA